MGKGKLVFMVFVVTLALSSGYAQQLSFKHYTTAHGLPSSEVYHVLQDKKGYMWFATDGGVARFDGYRFTTFTTSDGLGDITVFKLYEDDSDRIWFLPFSKRLSYYDNGEIHVFPLDNCLDTPAANGYFIKDVFLDRQDSLWIYFFKSDLVWKTDFSNTDAGCRILAFPSRYNEIFNTPALLQQKKIRIREKQAHLIGYIDSRPVFKVREDHSGKCERQKVNVFKIADSSYLIAYNNKLYLFKNGRLKDYASYPDHRDVSCIYQDSRGDIWISYLKGGLQKFKSHELFSREPALYLKNHTITSMTEDHEGGIWITTLENGVFYLASTHVQVFTKSEGLPSNKVELVNGHKEYVVFVTDISSNSNTSNVFIMDSADIIPLTVPQDEKRLLHFVPNKKDFWIGSKDLHLYRKEKLIYSLYGQGIYALYQDTMNKLYAGRYGRLCIYSFAHDKLNLEHRIELQNEPRTLYKYRDTLWIGCRDGLWSYQQDSLLYWGSKFPLLSNRITGIAGAGKDWLIFSTSGAGVVIKKGRQLTQLSIKDGLASNICYHVYVDEKNSIWLATNQGLSMIEHKETSFRIDNFTTGHGLPANEIFQVYAYRDKVWAATPEGLASFELNDLKQPMPPPPVYIVGIKVNDEERSLYQRSSFPYRENNISFTFVGLSYKNTKALRYRYRLKGVNKDWSTTHHTNAQYMNLAPGRYTFEVEAMTDNNTLSKAPAVYSFVVQTPFWKTWWFIIISLSIFMGIVTGIIRYRYRQVTKRNRLLLQINQYQQQALSAQINPHFIFNSLNSIQKFVLQQDVKKANKFLTRFARLMRIILENAREVTVTLRKEVDATDLYLQLEQSRFNDLFQYSIKVDEQIDQDHFTVPALILQPYVENALWHGLMNKPAIVNGRQQGYIKVSFKKERKGITCTIEDNGVGRKKANKIKAGHNMKMPSLGMKISEKRLSLHNDLRKTHIGVSLIDLKDRNRKPAGTRVILFFSKNTKQ